MELYFPSLLAVVLGLVVIVFFLPRLSVQAIGIASIILMILAVYQHWSAFPYEYSTSTIRHSLQDYAPFVAMLLTILFLAVGISTMTGGPISLPPMPELPALPELPAMPELPGMNLISSTPANKGSFLNFGGNSSKRNNVASTNFKIT